MSDETPPAIGVDPDRIVRCQEPKPLDIAARDLRRDTGHSEKPPSAMWIVPVVKLLSSEAR